MDLVKGKYVFGVQLKCKPQAFTFLAFTLILHYKDVFSFDGQSGLCDSVPFVLAPGI